MRDCDENPHKFVTGSTYYPYGASFINVVFLVYNYLRIGSDLHTYLSNQILTDTMGPSVGMSKGSKGNVCRLLQFLADYDDPNFNQAFGELVAYCFIRMHCNWLKISEKGTLLDFQEAINSLVPLLDKIGSCNRRLTMEFIRGTILNVV
ncbi:ELMO/CED-12 family protein [Gregarina niphandrodes]|uniref:ELMO/CED-12 family protein n=1 Tax=Gregarina niphandrodes TaxID=110365 RepID=A0A023B2U6_GRENI|nr:ELMO/CED-12 family protein [Gregarina niphandrodes]EZG55146.1 ELMO/CED-12 family protein [Gregarina niphandrodes]|eukprot:XP_011131756.1 ELMO/CED-12 family protein [Gregarina niphandrodes]